MSVSTEIATTRDQELVEEAFDRISKDLGLLLDREISIREVAAERRGETVCGEGGIHVSFKLGFRFGGGERQGCLLLPLPEAISLAGYLMMVDDRKVRESRSAEELDLQTKEAILEVDNFIAGAVDAALRGFLPEDASVKAAGCQGVRAGVRPALEVGEGAELIVGRARVRLHTFPEFEAVLILPVG